LTLNPRQIITKAVSAAEDKKAKNIVVLDIGDISFVSDYFIICSGNSSTQVKAIADNIEERLEEQGVSLLRKEGMAEARWVLLDYGDFVFHVFLEEERNYYNLERLWGDAKVVDF